VRFTVLKVGRTSPSGGRSIQVVSENRIAVSFTEPPGALLAPLQVLVINLESVGVAQTVLNVTTGETMELRISAPDVHDLTLPLSHAGPRFPTLPRRRGNW
jgi:hypothetical protein